MGHIYNMKNQFWAGLSSRAVLVKKKVRGRLWATFEARFFMFSWANFFFFLNFLTSPLKFWKVFFSWKKTVFLRAKNFNVSIKTLWSVLCWLLLWFCSWTNSRLIFKLWSQPKDHHRIKCHAVGDQNTPFHKISKKHFLLSQI